MMNEIRNIYILMYDITHDRTLQKVARQLEQHGYERINYSVWAGIHDPLKNSTLKMKLKSLLENPKAEGSKLYYLPMTIKDFEKMKSYDGKELKAMEYWIGKKHTDFF